MQYRVRQDTKNTAHDLRGPGGKRFLLLVAWKAVIWETVCVVAGLDSWVRATEESSVGAVRVEGVAEAANAADCRSSDERAADAMVAFDGL